MGRLTEYGYVVEIRIPFGRATPVEGSEFVNATFRIGFDMTYLPIDRARDGTEFARPVLPRLRAEYQPTPGTVAFLGYGASLRDGCRCSACM